MWEVLENDDDAQQRTDAVHAEQRRLHMEPRSDSNLTRLFAEGQLDPCVTPDVVARELMATDFIYKNTLYGEVIEEYMRHVAGSLRETYKLTWSSTWTITRFYAPIALKLMCLSASGVVIPPHLCPDVPISPAMPTVILPNARTIRENVVHAQGPLRMQSPASRTTRCSPFSSHSWMTLRRQIPWISPYFFRPRLRQ